MSDIKETFENRLMREAFEIFEELPSHNGYPEPSLVELEQHFGGEFPPTYRHLMLLDADRMANIPIIFYPSRLIEIKSDAEEALKDDDCKFQLQPNHVVFGWEDIYGFYFFETGKSDDVPVYFLRYYDNPDDGLPLVCAPNVRQYFAGVIRDYLKLEF